MVLEEVVISGPNLGNYILEILPFAIGMIIYTIFVFNFYKLMSKRDIIKLDLHQKYGGMHGEVEKYFLVPALYILEYIIFYPIISLFWFSVISIILIALSKSVEIGVILIIAISLVTAIRAAAFYKEELAKDLAKILPLTLLAIFLVDIGTFSFSELVLRIQQAVGMWDIILYSLLFLIGIEIIFRIITRIIKFAEESNVDPDEPPEPVED